MNKILNLFGRALARYLNQPSPGCDDCVNEILHIRHHSLFAPKDFDISPYFQIIKPAIDTGFDYRSLHWDRAESP